MDRCLTGAGEIRPGGAQVSVSSVRVSCRVCQGSAEALTSR